MTIDALNNRTTTYFDAAGNTIAVEDADNNFSTYVYDALNRASVTIDANSDRTTTLFDAVGNVTQVTDANGNATQYVYDALNRASVTIDANNYRTTTLFDANGNVTSITDASNNQTTFAFDALNRKISETDPHGNSGTFSYNAVGLMTGTTDRLNRERVFEFDALNRKTTEIWKSGGSPVETLTYSFDANSNMLTAADSDGTYTMSYDALNRVTVANDVWGGTLTMSYDAVGNRTLVEDSLGGVLSSTYDAANNLTKREFKDGTPEMRLDFAYTALNQVSDITRYSDLSGTTKVATSSFSYDALARIDHLQHKDSTPTNIANYTYTFDSAGNLATEELNGSTTTYTHDDTNQLTADGSSTFTYDGTGNRNNGSYTTGTGNQITNDGTWTFSYDDEGNMVKRSKGENDETWTYGYDHRNQMTWVEQRETYGGNLMMRADYEYDVFGNRIEKQVDSDGDSTVDLTERYAYDGWKPGGGFIGNENWDIWADLDGDNSNALKTRYVRGDAIDAVFARIESDDSIYWLLTDRLGSVRDVINNSGTVKDTLVYDGFGNITSETDSNFRGRYAWTGRELDTETELQYNRARYYDSSIGRWTSQDPIGFDAGDANLYRYIVNSPQRAKDPSGLFGNNQGGWFPNLAPGLDFPIPNPLSIFGYGPPFIGQEQMEYLGGTRRPSKANAISTLKTEIKRMKSAGEYFAANLLTHYLKNTDATYNPTVKDKAEVARHAKTLIGYEIRVVGWRACAKRWKTVSFEKGLRWYPTKVWRDGVPIGVGGGQFNRDDNLFYAYGGAKAKIKVTYKKAAVAGKYDADVTAIITDFWQFPPGNLGSRRSHPVYRAANTLEEMYKYKKFKVAPVTVKYKFSNIGLVPPANAGQFPNLVPGVDF